MSASWPSTWGSRPMRRLLERVHRWLASRGRLRVIMDHIRPDVEYMHRGYLIGGCRNPDGTLRHHIVEVCLHKILTSDDDFLHNHPAAYFSLILAGSYREHTLDGAFIRRPGHMRVRGRHSLHRLELIDGPVWTLFFFLGRDGNRSDWDFLVNGKLVPHEIHLGESA